MLFSFLSLSCFFFFFFKQKTAYEMRISDWSSDVCSSDLSRGGRPACRRNDINAMPIDPAAQTQLVELAQLRLAQRDAAEPLSREEIAQIGRASCRERVCQYV